MVEERRPTGGTGDGWARLLGPRLSPADRDAVHEELAEHNLRRLRAIALLLIPAMGLFVFFDQPVPAGMVPALAAKLTAAVKASRIALVALQLVALSLLLLAPGGIARRRVVIASLLVAELMGMAVFLGLTDQLQPAQAFYLVALLAFALIFYSSPGEAALLFGGGLVAIVLTMLLCGRSTHQLIYDGAVIGLFSLIAFTFSRIVYGNVLRAYLARQAIESQQTRLLEANAELELAAEEARRMAEAARAADVAKSTFLANMSHEIRTPMNGIVGMTELALDTPLDEEQQDYLRTVQECAGSLLRVIDDILDISKIEAGKVSLHPEALALSQLIETAVAPLRVLAGKKQIALVTELDAAIPGWVMADGGRLQQVLRNLLGNAIKFTSEGEVRLSIEPTQPIKVSPGETAMLRLTVRDSGCGIPPNKLQAIFRPFEQVDGSSTRTIGGTGLGLAISRQIVALMGGELSVTSELGKGSTFVVVLPLKVVQRPNAAKTTGSQAPALGSLRLLLAEDNATNRRLAVRMLETGGHEVTTVDDGTAALAALQNGAPFDAALLDVQMPGLDGYEVARSVREMETDRHIPLVAVTAHAMKGDREALLEAGFDAYVAKPFSREQLLAAIARAHMAHRPALASDSVELAPSREDDSSLIPR